MMICYLDANFLIAFFDPTHLNHQLAETLMTQLLQKKAELKISSLSLDEFIHNSLRFATIPRIQALAKIKRSFKSLSSLPRVQLINPPLVLSQHLKVLDLMKKYGLRSRDAYHVFIMSEAKLKYLVTFDQDFDSVFKSGKIRQFER